MRRESRTPRISARVLAFFCVLGLAVVAHAQDEPSALEEAAAEAPTTPGQVMTELGAALLDIWDDFINHLPLIIAGAAVLLLTWFAARMLERLRGRLFERLTMRSSLKQLVARLLTITLWVAGLMLAAMIVFPGMTPSRALTIVGAGSVAIGFAFKDIFENFLAGVLILAGDAFRPGDLIHCEDIEGKVESVSVRNSSIRTLDGQLVVVPNAMLFKNPVVVRTDKDVRRVTVVVGIAYGEDIGEATQLVQATVEGLETVHKDKPVQVFARELGASSVDLEVTWWTGSLQLEVRESRHEVISAVKAALDGASIEIPFPHRTLTFNDPVPVQLGDATDG